MSTLTTRPVTTLDARRRFTLDEWHRMIEAGVFRDDERLELLDGEIYEMAPIGRLHASVVDRLTRLFVLRFGTRAIVRVQGGVLAGAQSEPQPDIAVLRETPDFYAETVLRPENVFLVIEVADSSLRLDRAKLRIYAAAGIPEAWITNLPDSVLEVYREPVGGMYKDARVLGRGESIAPLAFPDLLIAVDEILGTARP